MKDTKNLIWRKALLLFSQYGFAGVSVKDIAHAVGIKDASLYNHYPSKQAIFDAILTQVVQRMEQTEKGNPIIERANQQQMIHLSDLFELGNEVFHLYAEDELVSAFRQMLVIEQYASPQSAIQFRQLFIEAVLQQEATIFQELIALGLLQEADPYLMAIHFYSPLFLFLFQYDVQEWKAPHVKELIDKHVIAFAQSYIKTV